MCTLRHLQSDLSQILHSSAFYMLNEHYINVRLEIINTVIVRMIKTTCWIEMQIIIASRLYDIA